MPNFNVFHDLPDSTARYFEVEKEILEFRDKLEAGDNVSIGEQAEEFLDTINNSDQLDITEEGE